MTLAIRKTVIVQAGGRIELSDPGLQPGDRAEVIVLVDQTFPDAEGKAKRVRELEALFTTIQALPQIKSISEDDITAEILAYRAGRR
jgi:hypothetical protein